MRILWLLTFCFFTQLMRAEVNIIPQPNQLRETRVQFLLDANAQLVQEGFSDEFAATLLQERIEATYGYKLNGAGNQIVLRKKDDLAENAYRLSVGRRIIELEASSSKGLLYGVQSLLQLFPSEIMGRNRVIVPSVAIPGVAIEDSPAFSYRGMHLDVGRHFFSKDMIKRYLDYMATYKMNTFHWHLTEDQGWRIEIKKYPKLTEVGAYRTERDGTVYGGYYTQEDVKEIVAYAQERAITVIPEIEMPGHATAALAAYPELGCTSASENIEVITTWGVYNDVFCAGQEATFSFLQEVLDEVLELFPSKYIHIGGDECPKTNWKACEYCQKRIKDEGLKDEHELQSYFIKRAEKYLQSKGRSLIGWDEILEGGLAPDATVMRWRSWREIKEIKDVLAGGNKVLMTPASHCYFDHYQGEPAFEDTYISGFTPTEKVYDFNPMIPDLTPEQQKYLVGGQANMWTEYILTEEQLEYMLLPRMLALSEALWTRTERKDKTDFLKRLLPHYHRLEQMGAHYFVPFPKGGDNQIVFEESYTLELENAVTEAEIRYTLNGDEPNRFSNLYTQPIVITETSEVRAQTFLKEGGTSKSKVIKLIKQPSQAAVKKGKKAGLLCHIYEGGVESVQEISRLPLKETLEAKGMSLPKEAYKQYHAYSYEGFLEVETAGWYQFCLRSNDGSAFFLNDLLLINGDGVNSRKQRTAKIYLHKGAHSMRLLHFKDFIEGGVTLEWAKEGKELVKIPADRFTH